MPRNLAFLICFTLALPAFGKEPSHSAPPEPDNMKVLFNGKDLEGWDGDSRLWSVRDGVIHGETTAENKAKGNTFLIWQGANVNAKILASSSGPDQGDVRMSDRRLPGSLGGA